MLRYQILPVTPFAQNCCLLWDDATGEAVFTDPGGEIERLVEEARGRDLRVGAIWLTHAHIDHAGAAGELAQRLDVPIVGPHRDDQFWIDMLPQQSQMFGFPPAQAFTPSRWLADGDRLTLGGLEF